jgi:hypothetical protein
MIGSAGRTPTAETKHAICTSRMVSYLTWVSKQLRKEAWALQFPLLMLDFVRSPRKAIWEVFALFSISHRNSVFLAKNK